MLKNKPLLPIILFFWWTASCNTAEDSVHVIPSQVIENEHIIVYENENLETGTVIHFEKDQLFEENDSLQIGYIGDIAVTDDNGLFLYDGHPSAVAIYQFSSNGDYIRQIGREGRGPGEYLSGSHLNIGNNNLLVYDRTLHRHLVYSIETGEHLQTVQIDLANMESEGPITDLRLGGYLKLNNELFLLSLVRAQRYYEDEPGTTRYFITDSEFRELSLEIFRLNRRLENFGEWQGMRIMSFFPFQARSLLSVSESGRIFTAVTDEFFIRELNHKGETIGGFYYSLPRIPVTREDARNSTNEMTRDIAENVELPDYWPVLDRMLADDEDRLWIKIETDESESQKWYVTEGNGEFVGAFSWPQESSIRLVKNGFLYAVENNDDSGVTQLTRFRVNV